ncbi:hypothetical protein BGX38DRAFT_1172592 [Terfezia claveryi]|nr:hypothetical protein BGX38DRAFT_1172592 [Terfezia claveryi]
MLLIILLAASIPMTEIKREESALLWLIQAFPTPLRLFTLSCSRGRPHIACPDIH